MAIYSYDPAGIIAGRTKDLMRFELGDTNVSGGAATAFLSDEEIDAMIRAYPTSWKRAKYELAKAVCMKLSFEVDVRNDGTSMSLNQRADRWAKLCDSLKKQLAQSAPMPQSTLDRLTRVPDRGHYFHEGMLGNPSGAPPPDEAHQNRV